jgi:hypothetical protein
MMNIEEINGWCGRTVVRVTFAWRAKSKRLLLTIFWLDFWKDWKDGNNEPFDGLWVWTYRFNSLGEGFFIQN